MRYPTVLFLSAFVIASGPAAHAERGTLDCSHRSLAAAVHDAAEDGNLTIRFTGVCAGPIVIQTDGLALEGVGTAVIDGGGSADAVTVSGATRVSLADFAVRNGVNGIVGVNGAHVTLTNITSQDNS